MPPRRRRPVRPDTSAAIGVGGTLAGCVAAVVVYAATRTTQGAVAAVIVAVVGLWWGVTHSDSRSDSDTRKRADAKRRGAWQPPTKWQD